MVAEVGDLAEYIQGKLKTINKTESDRQTPQQATANLGLGHSNATKLK